MRAFSLIVLLVVAQAYVAHASPLEHFTPSFATGYIIKGHEAGVHDAPFIVSLSPKSVKHVHVCGGTLIAKNWVVTAGHCVTSPKGMSVAAGLHDRTKFGEFAQVRKVDFGKVHNQFEGTTGPYDIALLHVSIPFTFNEYVQPASLPVRHEMHEGATHLYGWGQDKAYLPKTAKLLQTVETEIIEWKECKKLLPKDAPLHSSNLCSDSMQKHISACNGDSGGPLVRKVDGTTSELVGIVSWGYIPCGRSNMPSIYTRVSEYVPWITKMMSAYYFLFG